MPAAPTNKQKEQMADAALGNAYDLKQGRATMRDHFIETAQRATSQRGDTVRNLLLCQMSYCDFPAKEGAWVPGMDMQALVFTTGSVKGGKGGDQNNVALARHRDVLSCAVGAASMLVYLMVFCGDGAPGLEPVVRSKEDWYDWKVSMSMSN